MLVLAVETIAVLVALNIRDRIVPIHAITLAVQGVSISTHSTIRRILPIRDLLDLPTVCRSAITKVPHYRHGLDIAGAQYIDVEVKRVVTDDDSIDIAIGWREANHRTKRSMVGWIVSYVIVRKRVVGDQDILGGTPGTGRDGDGPWASRRSTTYTPLEYVVRDGDIRSLKHHYRGTVRGQAGCVKVAVRDENIAYGLEVDPLITYELNPDVLNRKPPSVLTTAMP
jgi:hypothetical protein